MFRAIEQILALLERVSHADPVLLALDNSASAESSTLLAITG